MLKFLPQFCTWPASSKYQQSRKRCVWSSKFNQDSREESISNEPGPFRTSIRWLYVLSSQIYMQQKGGLHVIRRHHQCNNQNLHTIQQQLPIHEISWSWLRYAQHLTPLQSKHHINHNQKAYLDMSIAEEAPNIKVGCSRKEQSFA